MFVGIYVTEKVIPANAGVILWRLELIYQIRCYPRECGGDPFIALMCLLKFLLSPRMRG